MTIGEKICKLRKQKGLSQEDVASMIHVSRQAVSKWERNESLPDLENVKMLCSMFGVSIDYLVNDAIICDIDSHTALPLSEIVKEAYQRKYKKWFFRMICVTFVIVLFNQIMHIVNIPIDSPLWRFTFGIGAPMKKLWAGALLLVALYVALLWIAKKPALKDRPMQSRSEMDG